MAQITLRDYLQETEDAISSKRVDEALASCQYILAYFPESLEAQRLLGEVYLAQGRLEDARNAFDWVLTNDPENVIAYCSRALVSERMLDYDTALDCYQQAYELSRGSSRIRQAFNDLSEKVGQPGFMLSRAGLARLYLRGSLLAQAIQEWDIVLAMTPDRLDARTGLLEAYWRLGYYDRVSQLAEQILHDVPGCIKALLLFAHATAPQDMLRSRDLMQRVIAFDPDLQMAHDLFADLKVKQPGDPFLKLLERPTAMLGEPEKAAPSATFAQSGPSLESSFALGGTTGSGQALSADKLASWGSNATWNNESTLVKPHSNTPEPEAPAAKVESPSLPSWMSDETFGERSTNPAGSRPDLDASSQVDRANLQAGLLNGNADAGSPVVGSAAAWERESNPRDTVRQGPAAQEGATAQAEPWQLLQNALNDISPEVIRPQPDPGQDENSAQSLSSPSWLSMNPFSAPMQENGDDPALSARTDEPQKNAAPPAWLSGLTQSEPTSLNTASPADISDASPALSTEQPVSPLAEIASLYQQPEPPTLEPVQFQPAEPVQPEKPAPVATDDEEMPAWAQFDAEEDDSEDEFSFGPDWLRSLGATALDEPEAELPVPVAREPEEEKEPQSAPHMQNSEPVSTQKPVASAESEVPQLQEPVLPQGQSDNSSSSWLDWQAMTTNNASPYQQPDMQPQELQQPALADSSAEPVPTQVSDPWAMLGQQMQNNAIDYSWLEQIAAGQTSAPPASNIEEALPIEHETYETQQEQVEQHVLTTLEDLDERLRSRGFIPMESNTLASIAQASDTPVDEPLSFVPEPQLEEQPEAYEKYEEHKESLSAYSAPSAFAELDEHYPLESPLAFTERSQEQSRQQKEPSWLTELGFGSVAEPKPEPASTNYHPVSEPEPEPAFTNYHPVSEPVFQPEMPPVVAQEVQPVQPTAPRKEQKFQEFQGPQPGQWAPDGPFASPIPMPPFEPAPMRQRQMPQVQKEEVPANPLLDGGLETTMKRPAVRLQPMKQRMMAQELHLAPAQQQKNRGMERANQQATEGSDDYRDRLVHGYQAQLIGDYDSAMQEYRVIIRNTPELLSEVVSNVRALLKLAPKYSAGYRVLGDAYMRQGEYLQAMEAYNKALTMAKKAKS